MPEIPEKAKKLIDDYLDNVKKMFPDLEAHINSNRNTKSSIASSIPYSNRQVTVPNSSEDYYKQYLRYLNSTSQLTSKLLQTHLIASKYGFKKPYEFNPEYKIPALYNYEAMITTPSKQITEFLTPLASYLSSSVLPYRATEIPAGRCTMYPLPNLDWRRYTYYHPSLDISNFPTLYKMCQTVVSASHVNSVNAHRQYIENYYQTIDKPVPEYLQKLPIFSDRMTTQAQIVSNALSKENFDFTSLLNTSTIDKNLSQKVDVYAPDSH